MPKIIKKLLKKVLWPNQIKQMVSIRNKLFKFRNLILYKIYSGNIFKLALMNLMVDSGASPQIFKHDNENIYFNSWKNSYVGLILREIYVDRVYDWFFYGKKGLVVLDLGANVGFFTQYARRFAKRVISVEPSAETFAHLERAKLENNWKNVDLVNAAVSDITTDNATFFHNNNNTTMRSLNSKMSDGSTSEIVHTLSLDDLFKKHEINHVDFLKMDVEGAELDIINSEGFKNVFKLIDAIEVEIHFTGDYKRKFFDIVEQYGLRVTKVKTAVSVYILTK